MTGGCAGGKNKGRAMQLVLDARGHNADHALVKRGVKEADGGRRCLIVAEQGFGHRERLIAHAALDFAAVAVDAVQCFGQFVGARRIVAEQALYTQRHVGQASGGVDARPQRKAEVKAGGAACLPRGDFKQRSHAGGHGQRAHPLQPLGHQPAVVGIELHDIAHRSQRDQGQQGIKLGLIVSVELPALAQLGAQRQQHIEHDANAGDGFAGKRA